MATNTTNFNLIKPAVNDPTDQNLWGGYLNTNFDTIDGILKTANETAIGAAKTANYTIVSTDRNALIRGDASGGAFDFDLPAASSVGSGFMVILAKIDSSSNAVTIDPSGSDTVDISTLASQYDSAILVSDGTSHWASAGYSKAPVVSPVKQIKYTAISASSGTSTIPYDNTTPTTSEGTQIATINIDVESGTLVNVQMSCLVSHNNGQSVIVSAFRGSTCIGVVSARDNVASMEHVVSFNLVDNHGTSGTVTYSFRVGGAAAGTWYVASNSTAVFSGQYAKNCVTLTEFTT